MAKTKEPTFDEVWQTHGGLLRIADAAAYLGIGWQDVRKKNVRIVRLCDRWFVSFADVQRVAQRGDPMKAT